MEPIEMVFHFPWLVGQSPYSMEALTKSLTIKQTPLHRLSIDLYQRSRWDEPLPFAIILAASRDLGGFSGVDLLFSSSKTSFDFYQKLG